MFNRSYFVYILASRKNGVLYIGVTNDLFRRIYEHRTNPNRCFTKKYFVFRLVYFEIFENIYEAISREKCLKKWKRQWKINLFKKDNPKWSDVYDDLFN